MSNNGAAFAERFVGARQGFQEFVVARRDADPNIVDKNQEIVDSNLTGLYIPTPFVDFADIEREYAYLTEHLPDDEQDGPVIAQKIAADQMMLRVLQGEEVNFDEYALATAGFVPEEVPDHKIEAIKTNLDEKMRKVGFAFNEEGVAAFLDEHVLTSSREIETGFNLILPLAKLAVAQYVPIEGDQIYPEYVNDGSLPWSGYMTADAEGNLSMTANIHPSRRYTPERIGTWLLHEDGGHVVQMQKWKNRIAKGEIHPGNGLIGMASPEVMQAELVACITEHLLPEMAQTDTERKLAEVEVAYQDLFVAAIHNAVVRVNRGLSADELIDQTHTDLLFEERARIERMVVSCRDWPMYRAAFLAYQYVRDLTKQIMGAPNTAKRNELINTLYDKPLTVAQINELVANL